ncbi:pyridine nucleotide-disulfide oxidoreductase [Methanomassiliicoccales archaeon RumEn M1]|jgi:peroxiredoxin family protein|nr:pyridine nucleotide-disulfide oxidoreductase [Methanomassiliicoccales archaeon RumEn M1]
MDETKKLAIVVSEGTFDKGMMAMIIGNTAAAMGMEVNIFFTFFGLNLLKKGARPKLPGVYRLFTGMFVRKMAKGGVENFSQQLETAKELGVRLYACSTSMSLMGIGREDMTEGVEVLGASGFLNIAADTDMQYFIG